MLFLSVILALTVGAHLLFGRAVLRLFMINSSGLKISLYTILILLSLCFMASFLLLRRQANSWTVDFYMFSAVWTGLFINLLLFHTPTNMILSRDDGRDRHTTTYWVPDTTFSPAQKLGVDLQLSGHTHAGQIFPFGYLTRLIYKSYDYRLRSLGAFSIYTTCGVGTWGPPMRTGNRPEIVVINLI